MTIAHPDNDDGFQAVSQKEMMDEILTSANKKYRKHIERILGSTPEEIIAFDTGFYLGDNYLFNLVKRRENDRTIYKTQQNNPIDAPSSIHLLYDKEFIKRSLNNNDLKSLTSVLLQPDGNKAFAESERYEKFNYWAVTNVKMLERGNWGTLELKKSSFIKKGEEDLGSYRVYVAKIFVASCIFEMDFRSLKSDLDDAKRYLDPKGLNMKELHDLFKTNHHIGYVCKAFTNAMGGVVREKGIKLFQQSYCRLKYRGGKTCYWAIDDSSFSLLGHVKAFFEDFEFKPLEFAVREFHISREGYSLNSFEEEEEVYKAKSIDYNREHCMSAMLSDVVLGNNYETVSKVIYQIIGNNDIATDESDLIGKGQMSRSDVNCKTLMNVLNCKYGLMPYKGTSIKPKTIKIMNDFIIDKSFFNKMLWTLSDSGMEVEEHDYEPVILKKDWGKKV